MSEEKKLENLNQKSEIYINSTINDEDYNSNQNINEDNGLSFEEYDSKKLDEIQNETTDIKPKKLFNVEYIKTSDTTHKKKENNNCSSGDKNSTIDLKESEKEFNKPDLLNSKNIEFIISKPANLNQNGPNKRNRELPLNYCEVINIFLKLKNLEKKKKSEIRESKDCWSTDLSNIIKKENDLIESLEIEIMNLIEVKNLELIKQKYNNVWINYIVLMVYLDWLRLYYSRPIFNKFKVPLYLKNKQLNKSKFYEIGTRRIIAACIHSLNCVVKKLCENIYIDIFELSIKSQLGDSIIDFKKLFDKKIEDIYKDFIPKSIPKEYRHKKELYDKVKLQIKYSLLKEKLNKTISIKKLNIILTRTNFWTILEAFINDKNDIEFINVNGLVNTINLGKFHTLKDYFLKFKDDDKEELKKRLIEINDIKLNI